MTLKDLSARGVSVWLDDLSRHRIDSGDLARAVAQDSVVGVTTNPTIFAAALSGNGYADALADLRSRGVGVAEAIDILTTEDVARACDVLQPVYDATGGLDGRVSLEVPPALAHDVEGTVEAAKKLAALVDRPGVMIKIPATTEGLRAITAVTAAGISVNVTLIFSLGRYRRVVEAYINGLERAREAGHDLSHIHSVASIFVSRVDTEIDARLSDIGTPEALRLRGRAGIANCRMAYRIAEEQFSSERFAVLQAVGAHRQRPLWASTGTKNPNYRDTLYVEELIAPGTVNTMPEATLRAYADHGTDPGDTVTDRVDEARDVLDAIAAAGVDYGDVMVKLEEEGLRKFAASWSELETTVEAGLR